MVRNCQILWDSPVQFGVKTVQKKILLKKYWRPSLKTVSVVLSIAHNVEWGGEREMKQESGGSKIDYCLRIFGRSGVKEV